MSSLLTLAKDLEQKSKAQQQNTGEMLKAAFSAHEAYVNQELTESAKRINGAISDHDRLLASALSHSTKGMLRMVSRTWLTIVLVSVLLIASSGGILWWQGQQIRDNYISIREQKDALEQLNAKTFGVRFQNDSNGQFLVLPKGVRAETSWTVDNGKRKAVKLVQE